MESNNLFPRVIDTTQYVKNRIAEIADLLEVVDNSSLGTGEVTKGPRTVLQRLPRHMRRRAMSHNIKRLPRTTRAFASKLMSKSKHRKKPPSRFWRRRPHNLLKNYARRQMKQIWLETHIWHAKRFRMVPIWGYKLPWTSFQRSFRPNYRDSTQKNTIMDQSYLHCFQIVTSKPDSLIASLSSLCRPDISVTFAFKPARMYHLETAILLFEPSEESASFIGPARFSWNMIGDESILCLWAHPTVSTAILTILIRLLDLKKKEDEDIDREKSILKSYSMFKLHNMKIITNVYENDQYRLLNLRDQLVRFSLVGPFAFNLLNSIIMPVTDEEFPRECLNEQRLLESHEFWQSTARHTRPDQFRDGTTISLLVEDPRIFRARKDSLSNDSDLKLEQGRSFEPPCPSPIFWNRAFRMNQLSRRLPTLDFDKLRADCLGVVKATPSKIPMLIVIRNIANKGSTLTLSSGLDLILPAGTGLDFWVALQMAGARAIGLKDRSSLLFENGRFTFPADIPDTKSGKQYVLQEKQSLEDKYLRRPYNRRIDYLRRLSVKFPFSFDWPILISDWTKDQVSEDGFYVLRNRTILMKIDSWLRGKNVRPDEIIREHMNALIPIKLQSTRSGCPKRHALICLPSDGDLCLLKNDPKLVIVENSEEIISNNADSSSDEGEDEIPVKKPRLPLPEFISLDITKKEKVVSLNEMFPDTEMAKEVKKHKKKAKETKKETNKCYVELPKTNYKDSCSRFIIGRIVRGDFSFSVAKGSGLGYCVLASLLQMNSRIVLYRNSTSKYFHPANLSVSFNLPLL